MYRLLLRLKPKLVIWYHQALGVVDESGGSIVLEQFYSNLVHLPLKRLTRYPGSGTSWVDHHFPGRRRSSSSCRRAAEAAAS